MAKRGKHHGLEGPVRERDVLPIVVGAHLEAEVVDRPLGYRLRDSVLRWARATLEGEVVVAAVPVVCCDLWYLNTEALMGRPTICIGRPEVNAASAYFANRLPAAFVVEQTLCVHLDVEFITLQACLWGANEQTTASAVDLFVDRYLDPFLRTAHGVPIEEGSEGLRD